MTLPFMWKFKNYKSLSSQNYFKRIGLLKQKVFILLILVICFQIATAQSKSRNFGNIDWKVRYIDANSVDSLAFRLTSSYHSDIDKVRAIFSWITQNIAYNTNVLSASRRYHPIKFL